MEHSKVIEVLKQVRNRKRGFSQTVDLLVNLKDLDLKKLEHQVDFFVALPKGTGRKFKVCALIGPELLPEAKSVCDSYVLQENFIAFAKDKKKIRKLAKEHAYFIGQANIMPQVATSFGRILGPKGKMPNPKAGCIVPPKTAIKPLYDRLQNTIRVNAKLAPVVQCRLGLESMKDEELAENFTAVYDTLVRALPNGEANVRAVYIKTTMGKPVKLK